MDILQYNDRGKEENFEDKEKQENKKITKFCNGT